MKNPYIPRIAEIKNIRQETPDVKTFQILLPKDSSGEIPEYLPGQFLEISLFGIGEAPISITSSPSRKDLEISVKRVGRLTESLHEAEIGDKIGVRGPYGNGFPINELKERDIIFIGGGIGLAPLRSLIEREFWKNLYPVWGENPPGFSIQG